MKKLIAGNWKMHGDFDWVESFDSALTDQIQNIDHVEWLICAPFPYIANLSFVTRGAQDCSAHESGAFTGEVAASMLSDMNVDYCIVGHSERRAMHKETNEIVEEKAQQVINNGMTAIICVGETLDEREAGHAYDIVSKQIEYSLPDGATAKNTVIAYEPVWAIGTGQTASACDVEKMHNHIRELLKSLLADGDKMRILYGGSVKPSNAPELLNMDNVGGALIGGASLKVDDFVAIGKAVER